MSEEMKIAHEALLKEMHKADDLVEKHSDLVITLTGAAFGFAATQLRNPHIVYLASAFGFIVAVEWLLKTARHKQIFMAARSRLAAVEANLGIDTARPVAKLNGFIILQFFAYIVAFGWIVLSLAVSAGWIPGLPTASASASFERVSEEMPSLTHAPGSRWNLMSMVWHEQNHTYDLTLSIEGKPEIGWAVVYDTDRARIIDLKKQ